MPEPRWGKKQGPQLPPDSLFDRPLPDNLDAEKYTLGAIMTDETAFLNVAGRLTADDFSLEKHRRIFLRMSDLYDRGERIERTSLANELVKHGQLHSVDGLSYIVSLDDGLPQIHNLDGYVRIIKEKSLLRKIINVSQDTIAQCLTGEGSPEEVLGSAEESLMRLSDTGSKSGLVSTKVIITEYEGGVNAFLDSTKQVKGIQTGFTKFDEMTGGMREGELIILAARPAMGKTALALNIAQHVAMHPKTPKTVAVFSLEMSRESLLHRMVCAHARVDSWRFRNGYLTTDERHALQSSLFSIVEAPLFLDDTPGTNLIDIHAKVRRLQAEEDLGLVVIDYLQLMQGRGRFDNRVQEISSLSRGFKLMSKELRVPFLVLSQLSRAPETRPGDHRPMLSDLRESGCLAGDTLIANAETGALIPISQVQPGMKVWSLDESTLRLTASDVTNSFCTGTKRVFTLTTRLGRTIEATANHPFRSWDGWKDLSRFRRGDRLALPRLIPVMGSSSLRPCELALLGHMIGNGCMLPHHVIQYTGRDQAICDLVASLATDCFGSDVAPTVKPERTWFQTYLTSTRKHTHGVHSVVRDWLHGFGLWGIRSPHRFIPSVVFTQSHSGISHFLAHLWATDGSITIPKTGYPAIYYGSSSQRLCCDVQSLLLRLGINSRIGKTSQMTKGRPQHQVIISGNEDLVLFVKHIGGVDQRRQMILREVAAYVSGHIANTNRDILPASVWHEHVVPAMAAISMSSRAMQSGLGNAYCGTGLYEQNISRARASRVAAVVSSLALKQLAESDIYWDTVDSIEYAGEKPVYDLTVPGHSNFVANDIIVHNSIEQDADMVGFIFREEVYKPDKESLKGLAELIIAKQRNGPTGRIKLAYLDRFTKFENLALGSEADSPFEE